MTRGKIFKDFLEAHSYYIDYNGENYTLVDKGNILITITDTSEEMYKFILGYNKALEKANIIIENLKENNGILIKQNTNNVEKYEQLLKDGK